MPSLTLAAVTYFGGCYFWLFAAVVGLVYIYKVFSLPYPSGGLAVEVVIYASLVAVETVRLFAARKGNLTDRWIPLVACLILSCPSILGVLYFLLWQTYVLRLEVVLVYIQLAFETATFLLSLLRIITLLYVK
ncbi:hypothetical protein AAG570_010946 [Ranatra chinensis]|uniref:Transmembrane protein 216 n=1 Tax=Ranatra chinensis TaxID=642074 RepID=A0ABD0YJ70_9HEMI